MNALFGGAIKLILALLQTQDAVGQDHGDGSDCANCCSVRAAAIYFAVK